MRAGEEGRVHFDLDSQILVVQKFRTNWNNYWLSQVTRRNGKNLCWCSNWYLLQYIQYAMFPLDFWGCFIFFVLLWVKSNISYHGGRLSHNSSIYSIHAVSSISPQIQNILSMFKELSFASFYWCTLWLKVLNSGSISYCSGSLIVDGIHCVQNSGQSNLGKARGSLLDALVGNQ